MLLVVQMGHVGRPPNSGSVGTTGEQEFTKRAGPACVQLLDGRGGWRVKLIPADVAGAEYRGDAFVALHCDGSTSPSSRGASVGYQTTEGATLAKAIKAAYDRLGWSGGWKADNYTAALAGYYGVANAVRAGNRRAMILECGTLTNADDRRILTAADGPTRVARAIGAALGIPTDPPPSRPEVRDMFDEGDRRKLDRVLTLVGGNWNPGVVPDGGLPESIANDIDKVEGKVDALTAKVDAMPQMVRDAVQAALSGLR